MCGLYGEFCFNGSKPRLDSLDAALSSQESRGPDGYGVYAKGPIALGHRRLKIIDLDERSAQPIVDSQLGLVIVFNGAIYNYRELRADLQAQGYSFFTEGDTEVILKAYHAWGESCLERLSGMFAFAIWSRDKEELFIARDRLGIKPLYFSIDGSSIRFASFLPALLHDPRVSKDINRKALHHYLSFHAVVPAPMTIFKDINKLPPATSMRVTAQGQVELKTYWQVTFGESTESQSRSLEEWKALTIESLTRAIKRRMVADVPVGILLSGGVDSSLVVGLLARKVGGQFKTFSIGFESVGDEKGDEFEYSDIIVNEFATQHEKIEIDSSEALENLHPCILAMAEPMVSHDAIGFYLLSREVSKHVKVVQSGQGADEIFAGYHWYPPMMTSKDATADYHRLFLDRDHKEMKQVLNKEWVSEDWSRQFISDWFDNSRANTPIDKVLEIDSKVMLVEDPVKRVDNMTMAWGLEARVPFLDHELVELAASMPAEIKVAEGGKYILKEAARSVIPHQVIDRPKGYFPVPALKYIRGDFLTFVKDIFNQKSAQERGIIRSDYLETLFKNPEDHITPLRGSKLWQAAVLEYWLQCHE